MSSTQNALAQKSPVIVCTLLLIFSSHKFLVNVSLAQVSVPIVISHPATVKYISADLSPVSTALSPVSIDEERGYIGVSLKQRTE
jgi:hypothetical protein